MNIFFKIVFLTLIGMVTLSSHLYANEIEDPILFPEGNSTGFKPLFVWQDLYFHKDKGRKKFKLEIKEISGQKKSTYKGYFTPHMFEPDFLSYRLPVNLENGKYKFTIERLNPGSKKKLRYFTFRKYPLSGFFNISGEISPFYNLTEEDQVKYIKIQHYNKIENGYNSIFFAGAATGSLALGLLFYTIIDYGIITDIIAYMGFISAGTGYLASGYYGYRYFSKKSELKKILKSGQFSLKGGIINKKIMTEVSYSY